MSESARKYTKISGLRYREHATRKHGLQKDKYFIIRYMVDGKRREEGLGWLSEGWTEKKAAARLFELKENNRTGLGPRTLAEKRANIKKQEEDSNNHEQQNNVLFKDIFYRYIERVKKDESQKSYVRKLGLFNKWICPFLMDSDLKSIKTEHIEKIKDNMIAYKQSERSVQYAISTISLVFKHAKSIGLQSIASPTANIKIPKKDNKRERFLTKQEAEILLKTLLESSEQMHDIALLSLYCGLRAGEIFKLEWQDVNFDSNRLFIKDRKNGGNANLPMHDKIKEMLLRRKEVSTPGIVFKSRTGGAIEGVSNAYERAIKKLGFNENITDPRQKVVFHTLRHTYASWLVMSDVDLYTVQRLMGHKDIAMTQRYAHLAPEHLDKAVSMLN